MKISSFELKSLSFELKNSNFELRTSSFELKKSSFESKYSSFELTCSSFKLKFTSFKLKCVVRKIRTCRSCRSESFRTQCQDLITSFIQDSVDKHIPSKTSRSVSSVPWITPDIRRKIRRKNKTKLSCIIGRLLIGSGV